MIDSDDTQPEIIGQSGEELVPYDGHEWRLAMNGTAVDNNRVVCSLCGVEALIGQWPDKRCHVRLAPKSWLPQA